MFLKKIIKLLTLTENQIKNLKNFCYKNEIWPMKGLSLVFFLFFITKSFLNPHKFCSYKSIY